MFIVEVSIVVDGFGQKPKDLFFNVSQVLIFVYEDSRRGIFSIFFWKYLCVTTDYDGKDGLSIAFFKPIPDFIQIEFSSVEFFPLFQTGVTHTFWKLVHATWQPHNAAKVLSKAI